MRLGAPIPQDDYQGPQSWVQAVQKRGYRAVYCPVSLDADDAEIAAYAQAASAADLVIAEVGAWSNPISSDAATRQAAIEKNKQALTLADKIGARCCVNITGSRGTQWDGPHPDNFTEETFDMIVAAVQEIIDAVKPERTFYTLETMPWIYPDSADSYLRLMAAIDRPQLAVHLDPVNIICSPQLYYHNSALLRECFAKLGPQIRSVHAKDILIQRSLTVHLDEVRPGLGTLDYATLLREMNQLDPDTPIMLEHLPTQADYELAAAYVRTVAEQEGIQL